MWQSVSKGKNLHKACTQWLQNQQHEAEKLSLLDELKGDVMSSSNWTLGCNYFLPPNPLRVCSALYFKHKQSGLIMEDSFPNIPLGYAILKESWENAFEKVICSIPCTATLSTGKPSSWAMKPMMPKMTKPAKKLVRQLPIDTTNASLLRKEKRDYEYELTKVQVKLIAGVTLNVNGMPYL